MKAKHIIIALIVFLSLGIFGYALSTSTFGNIVVQGNATINGTYVNVTGELYSEGNADFKQNLSIGEDLSITNDLSVGNNADVTGTLSVTENASVTEDILLTNSSEILFDTTQGKIYKNSTCVKVESPSGTGTLNICD